MFTFSMIGVAEDSVISRSMAVTAEAPTTEAETIPEDFSQTILWENASSESLALNSIPSKLTIGVKEKYTIDTSNMSGKLTFKSSKTKIATVSKKGVITGKKVGTAKITITPKKGKKNTITVTVAKAPSKVAIDEKTITGIEIGDEYNLYAELPSKTASNQLTGTSSNKNIVAVISSKNDYCTIKAKKAASWQNLYYFQVKAAKDAHRIAVLA